MYKFIVIDIETIPTQRSDVKEFIAATVQPPATYKKAESIEAWHKEQGPAAIEEAVNKTGLDGAFGQVVCIGFDLGDGAKSIYSHNERVLLEQFNDELDDISPNLWSAITVVGHNVSQFDLRFLMQRYIVNGVKPHSIIKRSAEAKPWESEKVYDTMIQFAGVGNRISLDKLCMALSLPGKGDITGKDVWPLVQAGKLEEVAKYCESDVQKTRAVFERMTFA